VVRVGREAPDARCAWTFPAVLAEWPALLPALLPVTLLAPCERARAPGDPGCQADLACGRAGNAAGGAVADEGRDATGASAVVDPSLPAELRVLAPAAGGLPCRGDAVNRYGCVERWIAATLLRLSAAAGR
jgi:hypothetical protein